MQGTSGSHNGKADGYYDTNGNSYSSGECKFVAKTKGLFLHKLVDNLFP